GTAFPVAGDDVEQNLFGADANRHALIRSPRLLRLARRLCRLLSAGREYSREPDGDGDQNQRGQKACRKFGHWISSGNCFVVTTKVVTTKRIQAGNYQSG